MYIHVYICIYQHRRLDAVGLDWLPRCEHQSVEHTVVALRAHYVGAWRAMFESHLCRAASPRRTRLWGNSVVETGT